MLTSPRGLLTTRVTKKIAARYRLQFHPVRITYCARHLPWALAFTLYRVRINYWNILQNHIFTNTEQTSRCHYHLKQQCLQFRWSPRRPNYRRNARRTATKLLHGANSRTHRLRSVGVAAFFLQNWFTGFPRDGNSDYRTSHNITFTVCNRHEFHDLATVLTRVMA
jgi:hypothetical protein